MRDYFSAKKSGLIPPSPSGGVAGAAPAGWVADKPTKRREPGLYAGAVRGAAWLGSEGGAPPFWMKNVWG